MRTKELRPNTRYATETGTCVETGDEVERGWYRWTETKKTDEGSKSVLVVQKGLDGDDQPAADPWARSKRAGTTRTVGGRYLRDLVEGVRVTAHAVDGEGNPTSSKEWVVDPKNIKGTWEDFVRLHGDRLKTDQLKRDAAEDAKARSAELGDLLKNAGLAGDGVTVRVDVKYMVDDRRHPGDLVEKDYTGHDETIRSYRLEPRLEAKGEVVQQLIYSYLSDGH